jgi:hypothetical protein
VQQRELFRAERADGFAALDDRLDQLRRVPLRGDDVVAFGFEPRLEQLALRRLARAVRAFEGHEQPAAPARVGEMFARGAAQGRG